MRSSQTSPAVASMSASMSVTLCLQRRPSGAYLPDPLEDDPLGRSYHVGAQQRPRALRGDELVERGGRRSGFEAELLGQARRVDHAAVHEQVELVERDG